MNLTPEIMKQFIEKPFPFIERMGLRAIVMEPCRIKLSLPLEDNGNHIGSMYAGALFTIAEVPAGALYLTSFDTTRFYPIVKEMNIRYRRPALTDVTIEMEMTKKEVARIETEAEKKGKADFKLEGKIEDTAGEVVAISCGIYQLRKIK